jgi:DNA-binding LytR/AlgR family response regulator
MGSPSPSPSLIHRLSRNDPYAPDTVGIAQLEEEQSKVCSTCGQPMRKTLPIIWLIRHANPRTYISVPVADILAIHSTDKYQELYTSEGCVGLISCSIEKVTCLEPHSFVRIHRNCAVRYTAIKSIELTNAAHMLSIKGLDKKFRVSRRIWKDYRSSLFQAITKYGIL